MREIKEIKAERGSIWDEMKKLNDSEKFSAKDQAKWDEMNTHLDDLDAEIRKVELYREGEAQKVGGHYAASNFDGRSLNEPGESFGTQYKEGNNIMNKYDQTGRGSEEYRAAFWKYAAGQAGDAELRALSTSVDPAGGYLLPVETESAILTAISERVIMRQLGSVINTTSEYEIPIGNQSGVASWIAESGAYPESDETFSRLSLRAYKLGTIMRVSEELAQDSTTLASYIEAEYVRRISLLEEAAFIAGNGVSKPNGVVEMATLGLTASSTTDMTPDEFIELFHACPAPYRPRASWLLNDSTVMSLRKKKASTGDYIWQPGVSASVGATILGRPYYTSSFISTMEASAKSVVFGDFSFYKIANRGGIVFQRLVEKYADTGEIGFKAFQRVDGRLALPAAVVYAQQAAA
ncbi:MAG: phage major capsid protein [Actinobacteria bacterium]|nr:phage major capsid protein [Actinomycetota bacterium]